MSIKADNSELSALALIHRHHSTLNAGHRRVADFILASPHEAALMTLEAIAQATGVSVATASRLGSKLGLAGFLELKSLLRSELQQALRPVEQLVETVRVPGLSRAAPWTRSLEADLGQISGVEAVGGDQAFTRAVRLLTSGRRVFLVGFGSSAFIASYGAFNLASLRDNVEAVTDSSGIEGAQRRILGASSADIALIIGFARYSAPAVQMVERLAHRGVPQIVITDARHSPLAAPADTIICVPRKQGFVLSGAGAGGIAVIEALLHGVAASVGVETIERRFARLTSALENEIVSPDEGSDGTT